MTSACKYVCSSKGMQTWAFPVLHFFGSLSLFCNNARVYLCVAEMLNCFCVLDGMFLFHVQLTRALVLAEPLPSPPTDRARWMALRTALRATPATH